MNRWNLIGELATRFSNFSKNYTELAVITIFEARNNAMVSGRRIESRGLVGISTRVGQSPAANHPPDHEWGHYFRGINCLVQRPQKAWLDLCWADHNVRLHAGDGVGQRPL